MYTCVKKECDFISDKRANSVETIYQSNNDSFEIAWKRDPENTTRFKGTRYI